MSDHATGARHPITASPTEPAWHLAGGLRSWMSDTDPTACHDPVAGPFVILEGPDGQDVAIPRNLLAVYARGILAAHVDAGRPDRWPR